MDTSYINAPTDAANPLMGKYLSGNDANADADGDLSSVEILSI